MLCLLEQLSNNMKTIFLFLVAYFVVHPQRDFLCMWSYVKISDKLN